MAIMFPIAHLKCTFLKLLWTSLYSGQSNDGKAFWYPISVPFPSFCSYWYFWLKRSQKNAITFHMSAFHLLNPSHDRVKFIIEWIWLAMPFKLISVHVLIDCKMSKEFCVLLQKINIKELFLWHQSTQYHFTMLIKIVLLKCV